MNNFNADINKQLRQMYLDNTTKLLSKWSEYYSLTDSRINEFGIVDVNAYNYKKGILFIGKETNGWDFSKGETFLGWISEMAAKKVITGKIASKHPKIWYNIGRWAKLIANPQYDKSQLLQEKTDALEGLRYIAFTNYNKVYGKEKTDKSFWSLITENDVKQVLKAEIDLIIPQIIVLCGIPKEYLPEYDASIKIIEMPHPTARNISNYDMLIKLEKQLRGELCNC